MIERQRFLSNATIDFNRDLEYNQTIEELSALGCKNIQIRIFECICLEALTCLMVELESSRLQSVEIIVPFSVHTEESKCKTFFGQYSKVMGMFIFAAEKNDHLKIDPPGLRNLVYVTENIPHHLSCPIHPDHFNTKDDISREAMRLNSCLHKKINIDFYGNLRLSPDDKSAYN
jgi:hypothetical protein